MLAVGERARAYLKAEQTIAKLEGDLEALRAKLESTEAELRAARERAGGGDADDDDWLS